MLDSSLMQALTSYAVPHDGALGRVHPEPEDETRTPFQRDRGRITHSQAFRRLQGKTQVFVSGEGDHYRSRLTHTMEVSQIARDIARRLKLNEDLTECIALAHDLGHPPFGHTGEAALDAWMKQHGSGFEHNAQSLRIVTVLEEHSSHYLGLNLSREILIGLQKHSIPKNNYFPSLEAQIVDLADEIAYTCHDSDDGLRAGLFTMKDITKNALAKRAQAKSLKRGTSLRGALIYLLCEDLHRTSIMKRTVPRIAFSHETLKELKELREFLWKRMYLSPSVARANAEGRKTVTMLCEAYAKHPPKKILELQKKTGSTLVEAIKDYVAGMTDRFALLQAKKVT